MSDAVGSDRLVVRPGRTADAPGVCAVIVRAVRESTSEFYSAEQVAAWADPVNVARMMALIEQTFTIVAVAEDRVVGFSTWQGGKWISSMWIRAWVAVG